MELGIVLPRPDFKNKMAMSYYNEKDEDFHWKVWHGSMGNEDWQKPICVSRNIWSGKSYSGRNNSEYIDHEDVLDKKMEIVAQLIRKAKYCVVYSGAALVRSGGIGFGTKPANYFIMNKSKRIRSPLYAQPTYSHHALTRLETEGLVKCFVQPVHDGVLQKAGCPQEKIIEIHGSWFDPSNPVVRFSGKIRKDLFEKLVEIEEKTDFCLCLGNSLSGMRADGCATTPCEKYKMKENGCLGTVVVNLSFTKIDNNYENSYEVPIRVWAKTDDALKFLMKHLGIKNITDSSSSSSSSSSVLIKNKKKKDKDDSIIICPFNKFGNFDRSKRMILELSKGKEIMVCHPDAVNKGEVGRILRREDSEDGHHFIMVMIVEKNKNNFSGKKKRRLGCWWLKCIQEGRIKQLPIVNTNPKFLDEEDLYCDERKEFYFSYLEEQVDFIKNKFLFLKISLIGKNDIILFRTML